MYWSIKLDRFREKFEVSADENRVHLDCTTSGGDNLTTTVHYWLKRDDARELAQALIAAVEYSERKANGDKK